MIAGTRTEAGCKQPVVAFDGDDTLWIDSTREQEWERRFRRLATLLSPSMEPTFRIFLKQKGFTIAGVHDALLATGRAASAGELPPEWLNHVEALPKLAEALNIKRVSGLDEALSRFGDAGFAIWIITKGDVVRQAIKLARFGQCHRFSRIEIIPCKSAAAYRDILRKSGVDPGRFLMIGDAFTQDVLPVVRLGARAAHVPAGRWALLRPLATIMTGKRVQVCRSLEDAARRCLYDGSRAD